jgi:hypothetical protein
LVMPCSMQLTIVSSSSFVHGPLTSPGRNTYATRNDTTRHDTTQGGDNDTLGRSASQSSRTHLLPPMQTLNISASVPQVLLRYALPAQHRTHTNVSSDSCTAAPPRPHARSRTHAIVPVLGAWTTGAQAHHNMRRTRGFARVKRRTQPPLLAHARPPPRRRVAAATHA